MQRHFRIFDILTNATSFPNSPPTLQMQRHSRIFQAISAGKYRESLVFTIGRAAPIGSGGADNWYWRSHTAVGSGGAADNWYWWSRTAIGGGGAADNWYWWCRTAIGGGGAADNW